MVRRRLVSHKGISGRTNVRGRIRFGASEDFVQSSLPEVLRDFTRIHRAVDLELTVGLSGGLLQALDAGELDLVLAKRRPGEERGRLVRREKLVWVASDPALLEPDRPLPLILYPPPSISRAIALEALERTGRSSRMVCTSSSFSGLPASGSPRIAPPPDSPGAWPHRVCPRRPPTQPAQPSRRAGNGHSRQC